MRVCMIIFLATTSLITCADKYERKILLREGKILDLPKEFTPVDEADELADRLSNLTLGVQVHYRKNISEVMKIFQDDSESGAEGANIERDKHDTIEKGNSLLKSRMTTKSNETVKESEERFKDAIVQARLGNLKQALTLISQAVAMNPRVWKFYDCKAQILLALEEETLALKATDIALSLSPNSSSIWITRGRILRNSGMPLQAFECFQRVVNGTVSATRETRLEAVDEMIEADSLTKLVNEQKKKLSQESKEVFDRHTNLVGNRRFSFTGASEWVGPRRIMARPDLSWQESSGKGSSLPSYEDQNFVGIEDD